jgi:hypothetical protein
MYEKEIILLIAASALVIYLTVTQDGEYVPIAERPRRKTFGRNVINYYGWKGPFFIDDFNKFEEDAKEVIDRRKATPLGAEYDSVENFDNFFGPNNPLNEVVPVQRPNKYLGDEECVYPKYNKNNEKMKKCHAFAKQRCRVPSYNAEHGWRNEYHNETYKMTGPSDEGSLCRAPDWRKGDPGNYRQATNNNLDAPNNLKCQARSRYMDYCHPRDKVSPVCYATMLNECMGNKTNISNQNVYP